jgi:hypothetical protein
MQASTLVANLIRKLIGVFLSSCSIASSFVEGSSRFHYPPMTIMPIS